MDSVGLVLLAGCAAIGLAVVFPLFSGHLARLDWPGVFVGVALIGLTLPQTQLPQPADLRLVTFAVLPLLMILTLGRKQFGTTRISAANLSVFGLLLLSALWSTGTVGNIAAQAAFIVALLTLCAFGRSEKTLSTALYLLAAFLIFLSAFHLLTSPSTIVLADRLRGPFTNPNSLAALIVLLYPLLAGRSLRRTVTVGVPLLAVVWYTGSRAAVLAVVVATLILTLGRLRGVVRVAAVLGVAGTAAYLVPQLLDSAASNGAGDSTVLRSNNSRASVWSASLDRVREAPWWGSGLGSFGSEFETGSSLFSILLLVGIFGLVVVATALLFVLVRSWRSVGAGDWRIAVVIGGLINAAFEGWLVAAGTVFAVVFWLSVESLAAERKRRNEPVRKLRSIKTREGTVR